MRSRIGVGLVVHERVPSVTPAEVTTCSSIPLMRIPLSRFLPKTRGLPCSSRIVWSSLTSLSVRFSQAPSLKMLQFWRISMKAVPLCAAARRKTALRCGWKTSTDRATNVASAPSASEAGLKGRSTEP